MNREKAVITWLLDSDPSIRWQVLRDLADAPPRLVASERSRVAEEGWGARLLAVQTPDGQWGGGGPSDQWRFNLNTLDLLRRTGIDPRHPQVRKAIGLTRDHVTWGEEFDDNAFFEGEVEACINGRVLAIGAYFGEADDALRDRLLGEQLDDGGWNCDAPPSTRSSFHSTICVLEGLLEYERAKGATPAVAEARRRGEEYLLERSLCRSLSTGELIDRRWTRFAFPPGSDYDILRGLDYFRDVGGTPDPRLAEALEVLRARRHGNGRWPLTNPVLSHQHLDMESGNGAASRWNTLRAMRVLARAT